MRYTDVRTTTPAYGCRSTRWAPPTSARPTPAQDPRAHVQIFDAFVAAGGTTFDTSNIYQDGQAETLLGELLGAPTATTSW